MRKVPIFQTLYEVEGVDMRRIFPTKQRQVRDIHEEFKSDERISSIMVFGSAASDRCHQGSDIDILVRLKDGCVGVDNKNEISEKIQNICDWNADVLWYDRIDESDRIYNKILEGVRIV